MFASLNRFIARLDSEPQGAPSQRGIYGFQVLRHTNAELAIEPWFDFVVGINGHAIESPEPALFATEIRNCAGSSVNLELWSAKGQRRRSVYILVPSDGSGLGLSLQWAPLSATEDVWHILDVTANSPADIAGLFPYGDYVLGSPDGITRGESGLVDMIEAHIDRPLRLWVYNHEYNVTRLVTLTPSRSWGGSGALGCVLGFGALHRVPAQLDEPPQAPGETLFSTRPSMDSRPQVSLAEVAAAGTQPSAPAPQREASSQMLIPADMVMPPPPAPPSMGVASAMSPGAPPPPAGVAGRRPKPHHGKSGAKASAAVELDDYFNEGETKSRENDQPSNTRSSASGAALPPPPKVGEVSSTTTSSHDKDVDGDGEDEAGEKT